jgi:hypothetical protein
MLDDIIYWGDNSILFEDLPVSMVDVMFAN